MRKKTLLASRKLSKNRRRNTLKRKRMKRNYSKKKTKRNISKNKRTKGGFWGRCHEEWVKSLLKSQYLYIVNVHGNFRVSWYDIKIPYYGGYIIINNIKINKMKELYEKIKSKISDFKNDFESFTFTNIFAS